MRQYLVFGIFLFISQKGKVSARQIAEKFEISTRTAYRYIDTLSFVGVPVVSLQGRNGGISIMDGFKLDSLAFSKEEKDLIKSALLKDKEHQPCVEKILKALN